MAEVASDSAAPRPISSRTRSKLTPKKKVCAIVPEAVATDDDEESEEDGETDGAGAGAT